MTNIRMGAGALALAASLGAGAGQIAQASTAPPRATAAQSPPDFTNTQRTQFYSEANGGTSGVSGGKRTAYGLLGFGGPPGAYVVHEHQASGGAWVGTFTLYFDWARVRGTTRLTYGPNGFSNSPRDYTRTYDVTGASSTCFSPSGSLESVSEPDGLGPNGAFSEAMGGGFSCQGHTPGHGGEPGVNHRFSVKIPVTTGNAGLIGTTSATLYDYKHGDVIDFSCGTTGCEFQYYDGGAGITGTFPATIRKRPGGGAIYSRRNGSTQISGTGDAEPTYATAPWSLTGSVNKHGRGTLTLRGALELIQ